MTIYTRRGDKGKTSLLAGRRIPKTDLRVQSCGTLDELNSAIGVVLSFLPKQFSVASTLLRIQNDLFEINSEIAAEGQESFFVLTEKKVRFLEKTIDRYEKKLPGLEHFIFPGGSQPAALLFLARAIARRAERQVVALSEKQRLNSQILAYLNRLSDLLFVLARFINFKAGVDEKKWQGCRRG